MVPASAYVMRRLWQRIAVKVLRFTRYRKKRPAREGACSIMSKTLAR
jgi:hypothetical protein